MEGLRSGDEARRIPGPLLALYAAGQRSGRLLGQSFVGAPLTPEEFAVYSWLRLVGERTPGGLAADLGMRPSTLSSYLAKMQSRGHARRVRDPFDGRSSKLSLTPAGLRVTDRSDAYFVGAISAVRDQLGDDWDSVVDALDVLSRALDGAIADVTGQQAVG